jgi:hypothetical protein
MRLSGGADEFSPCIVEKKSTTPVIGTRLDRVAARALLAALVLSPACSKGPPGRKLASGLSRDVAVSAQGEMISFLQNAAHPGDRRVPEDLVLGDLLVARVDAGPARRVGAAVPNLPGAVAFSPAGTTLAFLAAYRYGPGDGELWLAGGASPERKIASGVTTFRWAPPDSGAAIERIALVADGRLLVLDAAHDKGVPSVGLDHVQTFAWAPGGRMIAARAPSTAGGAISLLDVQDGRSREAARASSDFAFGPDGALYVLGPARPQGGDRALAALASFAAPAREIGRATSFAVARTGDVALLSTDDAPGEAYGTLSRAARGSEPRRLASRVSDFRFTPRGDLVFLAGYDTRSRAGRLVVSPASAGERDLGERVQSFSVTGDRVLFIAQRPLKGDFKIELWIADLTSPSAPRKVDEGVYGYQLAPDGQLFWKARCAGGPRSCTLFRAPADGSAPAQMLAESVAGFDLSGDGSRVLVQAPHRGSSRAVDLAAIPAGAPARDSALPALVSGVDPSSRFADPNGKRIVYAAIDPAQAGVYVVDVP